MATSYWMATNEANHSGNGVALICKQSLTIKQQKVASASSYECMEILTIAENEVVRLAVVYHRPPSGGKSNQPVSVFIDEFYSYIDKQATMSGKLSVVGDFNFHVGSTSSQDTKKFVDIFHSLNPQQHVHEPTHNRGHILDLVLTRCNELTISNLQIDAPIMSDHGAAHCNLPLGKPPCSYVITTSRNFKNIDIEAFQEEIINSSLYRNTADDENGFIVQYNTVLPGIRDAYAPEKRKKVVLHPQAPWFTDDIWEAKRVRRAERRCTKVN